MGLMQRCYETYCAMEQEYAGRYIVNQKEPLAPVSHTLVKADITISLDKDGIFKRATDAGKDDNVTIIPVTEVSSGRTGENGFPHPLCDQLCYLSPCYTSKYVKYLEELRYWVESEYSHPKLSPILRYVESGKILEDLERSQLIELDENGKLAKGKDKTFIRWEILDGDAETESACWKDRTLMEAFIRYNSSRQFEKSNDYCMILGEKLPLRKNHPKAIPFFGNAKLISYKDDKGLGVNDRFESKFQEATVSDLASTKAHSALRWLAVNQGVVFKKRLFLCWNPQGVELPSPHTPLLKGTGPKKKPSDYQQALFDTLKGWKERLPRDSAAIIASFDAATSGRLSLTYYSELKASNFLERLHDWDRICSWYYGKFGIQSPSLKEIVKFSFGVPRKGKDQQIFEVDEHIEDQQIQRLLRCRVGNEPMPLDIVRGIVNRASNLQILDQKNRDELLSTACAVIRKYYSNKSGEEWNMALEPKKQDRSYQFGRLLAVLEKIERDTFDEDEKREPNAIRLMTAFIQRPSQTAAQLMPHLKTAYYPQLKGWGRVNFDRILGQIIEMLSSFPENEQNRPLRESYLMGYYLQKNEMYKSKSEKDGTEE